TTFGLYCDKANSEIDLRIDRGYRLATHHRSSLTNRPKNFGTAASPGSLLPDSARPALIDALRSLFRRSYLRSARKRIRTGRRTNCLAEREKPSNWAKTPAE